MRIDFYKCLQNKSKIILTGLLEKAFTDKTKCFIVINNEKEKKDIDKLLWEYKDKSWLPHLTTDDENSDISEIVLSSKFPKSKEYNINQSEILCIVNIDYSILPENKFDFTETNFKRIIFIFDKDFTNTKDKISQLKENELKEYTVNYFTQNSNGKWE